MAKFLAEIITIISEQKSLSDFRGSREMLHYAYQSKIKEYNRTMQDEEKVMGEVETEEKVDMMGFIE